MNIQLYISDIHIIDVPEESSNLVPSTAKRMSMQVASNIMGWAD